jgi:hypothetical protein
MSSSTTEDADHEGVFVMDDIHADPGTPTGASVRADLSRRPRGLDLPIPRLSNALFLGHVGVN